MSSHGCLRRRPPTSHGRPFPTAAGRRRLRRVEVGGSRAPGWHAPPGRPRGGHRMTVRELYGFAIERGLDLDPRGREALARQMDEARAEYDRLDEKGRA